MPLMNGFIKITLRDWAEIRQIVYFDGGELGID